VIIRNLIDEIRAYVLM